MTPPNNTVAGLAANTHKHVEVLDEILGGIPNDELHSYQRRAMCAAIDALASPAPSAGVGCIQCDGTGWIEHDIGAGGSATRCPCAAPHHPAVPSVSPAYDRELIARMLDEVIGGPFSRAAVEEQARFLREADNAEAANVSTVSAPPSVAGDAGGELQDPYWLIGQLSELSKRKTIRATDAWHIREAIELIRRLATAEQPAKSIRVGFSTQGEPMYANVPAEQPCPKCAKTFTGYCDSCAAKLDGQPGWTPDVAKQPGSAVQGESREQEAAALGNILRRFSAELSLHERASLTIAVQVLSGTTPPPAPAAEQGDPRAQYDASGRLIAYDARGGGMYTQPDARDHECAACRILMKTGAFLSEQAGERENGNG